MTTHGGSAVVVPRILNLGSGWWVISFTPRPLYREKRTPGFHLTGVWMGLKAGSNTEEQKISELSLPSPTHYTDWPISCLLEFLIVTKNRNVYLGIPKLHWRQSMSFLIRNSPVDCVHHTRVRTVRGSIIQCFDSHWKKNRRTKMMSLVGGWG